MQRARFQSASPNEDAWSNEHGAALFTNTVIGTIETTIQLVGRAIERADELRLAFDQTMREIGELDEEAAAAYDSVLTSGEVGDDPDETTAPTVYEPEDDGTWDDEEDPAVAFPIPQGDTDGADDSGGES